MLKMYYTENPDHPECQYLDLARKILLEGSRRLDRTKVGTRAIFGTSLSFNLADGTLPVLTTKLVRWQAAIKEMLWFLKGETNIRSLLEEGVTIWSDWPHKKYCEATGDKLSLKEFEQRILESNEFASQWGDLGPVYGKQWRAWRDYEGGTIDQVSHVIDLLKKDPFSRRIIIEGWNVAELKDMALTPCHKSYQFFVEEIGGEKTVSLLIYQRSVDVPLGLPFNIVGGSFLLHLVAQQVGMKPGFLKWSGGDTHIYDNQIEGINTQLSRTPKAAFPKLVIKRHAPSLFDYKFSDFELIGYEHHPAIKMDVAV